MTKLSDKMDSIAKNGYRANLARRILKGQEDRMVKQAIILDIIGAIQDLDGDTLTELYEHVKFLRKRQQLLPEQPKAVGPTPLTSKQSASTDGQPEPFDGKLANPIPKIKWFGRGCGYQCCKWEYNKETGGPEYKEADPVLIFCNHPTNSDKYEGNCTEKLCPLSE